VICLQMLKDGNAMIAKWFMQKSILRINAKKITKKVMFRAEFLVRNVGVSAAARLIAMASVRSAIWTLIINP